MYDGRDASGWFAKADRKAAFGPLKIGALDAGSVGSTLTARCIGEVGLDYVRYMPPNGSHHRSVKLERYNLP